MLNQEGNDKKHSNVYHMPSDMRQKVSEGKSKRILYIHSMIYMT